MNYRITKEEIFQATDGGLDIIRFYISDIDDYIGKNKKFAIRDEKTPSCAVKQLTDGNYVVADFGADGKWMNGIAITQKFENCEFGEAIKIIAERHGLATGEQIKSMYEPEVSTTDAAPDQNDGEWYFNHAEEASESHLKILFSERTWTHIESQYLKRNDTDRKDAVLKHFRSILKEQHWHVLESYTIIKNRKAITFTATEFYPIFRIEEERKDGKRFSKIYQPKSKDKSKRFFYHGAFDAQFLHGYNQVKKAYEELLKQSPEDESEEDSDKKTAIQKLDEIIYCTGGSDALNFRALGYHVVYPSSEHFKLTKDQLFQLNLKANNVMTCPDLDYTGQLQNHRLCMTPDAEQYLDIRTIELPSELGHKRDQYGRPCKDLRDFLKHYKATDLRNQVKVAMMYRFWDYQVSFDRSGKVKIRYGRPLYEYKLSIERVVNFLVKNGFGRRRVNEETMEFIQIDGNIVRQVRAEDIKAYLLNFLRSRFVSEDLLNVVHRSTNLSSSTFDSLPVLNPDFRDYDHESQYMFFKNITWKITAAGIEEIKNTDVKKMVWESRILDHKVQKAAPMFTYTKDDHGKNKIAIHNQDSMFFRFLIQTSRIHWRKELEDNLDPLPTDQAEQYRKDNLFQIHGPNLTEAQQQDQVDHLLNKMTAFGYMMHRYKSGSNSWSPFAMDDAQNKTNDSKGGTGKSIFYKGLSKIKRLLMLDGKDVEVFKDKHVFEQVTTNTDIIYIDDAEDNFPYRRTFSMTTGDITVNPKGKTRSTLAFELSPKIGWSSNYYPDDISDSTLRRVLFMGFANYYHVNKKGNFRETRQPIQEFGKEFWSDLYTEKEWELDFNFMAQCCHLYLSLNNCIEAPADNIMHNTLIGHMGANFHAWAEVFFAKEAGRLDCFVPASYALEEYKLDSKITTITTQGFNAKVDLYAQLKRLTLNPAPVQNNDGRVLKNWFDLKYETRDKNWVKVDRKKTQSMIYLQTKDASLIDRIFDPTAELIPADGFPIPEPGTEKPKF